MKTLITLLFAAMLSLSAFGATATITQSAAGTNSILAASASLRSLTLVNASGSAVAVKFFDAPSTALTYTNAAWTTIGWTAGTTTNIYTNILGNIETNTYTTVTQTTSTNAASTNSFATVLSLSIPASTTVTWEPASPLYLSRGLLITNGAAVSGTVSYNR